MDNARKMVLLPAEVSANYSPPHEKRQGSFKKEKKSLDKVFKIVSIALKLAKINAFDQDGRIRNDEGEIVPNSNMAILLQHAMKNGRVLVGEEEFIKLLQEANVTSDLILNDNIRNKLNQLSMSVRVRQRREPTVYERLESPPETNTEPPKRKRKIIEEEEDLPTKIAKWDYLD